MKRKDEIGTPFDDGVRRGVKVKYADKARAQIEHYEKHGYPTGTETGTPTGPDPLNTDMQEAAWCIKVAHENAAIEKARADATGEDPSPDILTDNTHAFRLHYELDRLREALDGGDVRHAARAGVAFGKALEEMRVRLVASAVQLGRKNKKSLDSGRDTYKRKGATLDILAWAAFKKAKKDKPSLNSERAWCEHAAIELNKEHKESRERALSAGTTPEEVDKQWPEWTMAKVKGRIQKFKK